MTRRRSSTDTWEPLVHVRRWDGSAFVDVTFGRRWDGTQWVEWWPIVPGGNDFQAVPSTDTALGISGCTAPDTSQEVCPFIRTVVSEDVTITPQGGTGSPVYSWAFVSGDSSVVVSNPAAATVSFSSPVGRNSTRTAVWRCTVTRGLQTASVDINVSLTYIFTFDGINP